MLPYIRIAHIKRKAAIVGITGVVIIALASWLFAHMTKSFFIETKAKDLKRIVATMAKNINPDEHATLHTDADMTSPNYTKISNLLEDYQRENPEIVSAYTMRVANNQATFIIDPPADLNMNGIIDGDLEKRVNCGTLYTSPPASSMLKAASGEVSADTDFVTDRWGTWLTSCAPLKTLGGHIDGIVCADEDQKAVLKSIFKMNLITGTWALLSAILLFGLLYSYVSMKGELGVRKIMEEERETSVAHFIAALEHLAVISVRSFDPDGIVGIWNRAAEKIWGIPGDKVIGNDMSAIFTRKEDMLEFKKGIDAIVASKQPSKPQERTINTNTGEVHTLISTMFPIIEAGRVTEVFCMDIDVTERKNLS